MHSPTLSVALQRPARRCEPCQPQSGITRGRPRAFRRCGVMTFRNSLPGSHDARLGKEIFFNAPSQFWRISSCVLQGAFSVHSVCLAHLNCAHPERKLSLSVTASKLTLPPRLQIITIIRPLLCFHRYAHHAVLASLSQSPCPLHSPTTCCYDTHDLRHCC